MLEDVINESRNLSNMPSVDMPRFEKMVMSREDQWSLAAQNHTWTDALETNQIKIAFCGGLFCLLLLILGMIKMIFKNGKRDSNTETTKRNNTRDSRNELGYTY